MEDAGQRDELTGTLKYHAARFQNVAASGAAIATATVIASAESTSEPTVRATATPITKGPARVPAAASSRAPRALRAREAIMVATTLALSWKPFTKS